MRSRLVSILLAVLALAGPALPALEAGPTSPSRYVIQPGKGVGPIALGVPVVNYRGIIPIPGEGIEVWIDSELIARIKTTNPLHRTATGFGPGQNNWEAARESLCGGASVRQEKASGFEIYCPFAGLVFDVSNQTTTAVEVVPPEKVVPASLAGPSSATGPGTPGGSTDVGLKARCEHTSRVEFVGGDVRPGEGLTLRFGVVYSGPPSYEPEALQGSYTVSLNYGNARTTTSGKIITVSAIQRFTTTLAMCGPGRQRGCVAPGFSDYSVTAVNLEIVHCRLRTR